MEFRRLLFRSKAANMMVEESGNGSVTDKFNKIQDKTKGLYNQMRDEKSVGIVEEYPDKGLVKYIKPMGVIAALVPITQGEGIPIFKTLMALKGRSEERRVGKEGRCGGSQEGDEGRREG